MQKLLVIAVVVAGLAGAGPGSSGRPAAASFPNDDKAILHVLNRIGFGARPGDVARVRQIGLQRYIEQQLQPDRISDDSVNDRLAGLTTVGMSPEIATRFQIPQMEARRARRQEAGPGTEPDDRPRPAPEMVRQANQPLLELSEQKLLRAVYSERQLQEVLTDFWFNHFNVDARKGPVRFMVTEYERDVIRPQVLGTFRHLLGATAKSPAMLFYLDNWMSADPNGRQRERHDRSRPRLGRGPFGGGVALPRRPAAQDGAPNRAPRGLNENYGRELMELHTLGVDGGYTQQDVTEVARAFTGWTLAAPLRGGGFKFESRIHDAGEKVVLGNRIEAGGGQRDGEQVLDILARHPSTSRFIATKLVRRFVSDTPPAALVDRTAASFRDTDGDLLEVMRTILTSPEFLAPEARRAKVKTPFEFLVSAVRATGADVQNAAPLVRAMQQLGMPLYQCQPPTGYKDEAESWINAGALVNRMNTVLDLARGQLRGVSVDRTAFGTDQSSTDLPSIKTSLIDTALGDEVSEVTRTTIEKAETAAQVAALTLGAPEFQRR